MKTRLAYCNSVIYVTVVKLLIKLSTHSHNSVSVSMRYKFQVILQCFEPIEDTEECGKKKKFGSVRK